MDTTEAVAALQALGSTLSWKPAERADAPGAEIATDGFNHYFVFNVPEERTTIDSKYRHRVSACNSVQHTFRPPGLGYLYRADAKAACERHSITGKWE